MRKDGEAKRRWRVALGAALAASGTFAPTESTAWSKGDEAATATTASGTFAPTESNATTEGTRSEENASRWPDPGDDWILRKKRDDRVETAENGGAKDASNVGNEQETERFATLADVAAVGRIVAIDATGIETEDRRRDRRERTPKRPGDAILFLPPVDPSAAEAFCVEIRDANGADDRDRFWLRNGDAFDGELLRVDRRRVWIRAFDVEFAVPRGRVRAVRFAKSSGKEKGRDGGDGKRTETKRNQEAK